MNPVKHIRPNGELFKLSLFCGKVGDAWRVMAWPGWLPGFLRSCFDERGEAYPVYLDLEELDRQMENSGVEYEKIDSPIGGVELSAQGAAATVLAVWLSKSFATGKQRAGIEGALQLKDARSALLTDDEDGDDVAVPRGA